MSSDIFLERADKLARTVANSPAGSRCQIVGGVGLGKTTLLQALKTRLPDFQLLPVWVSPPVEAMDTGCAAMVQIGADLHEAGLVDGQLDQITSPRVSWDSKLQLLSKWIEEHAARVVLLCDEPERWPMRSEAEAHHASYNNNHAAAMADWVRKGAACRRIDTTAWRQGTESAIPQFLPNKDLPLKDMDWGPFDPIAVELKSKLGARLSQLTFLEMRLLVTLAAVTSVQHAIGRQSEWPSCWELAKTLLESLKQSEKWRPLQRLLSRLRLVRGPLSARLIEQLGVGTLDAEQRRILEVGLLASEGSIRLLHPVLKNTISQRLAISAPDRVETHRVLAAFYGDAVSTGDAIIGPALPFELERFHHAASSGERDIEAKAYFVDQLHTLGRALSRDFRNYTAAAEVFRIAIQWDDQDDYAHHYLAFNLDCAASDQQLVERGFLRAIELNPAHPWWWSRWINFLITVGKVLEARREWSRAMNALGTGGGNAPDWVYEALHLWVARLLLHRVQLEFAEDVLDETRPELRRKHAGFRALDQLLQALKIARHGRGVFPVHVAPDDYWKHAHLDFPKHLEEKPFRQWNPARVDAVDEHAVSLVVGKLDEQTGEPIYGQVELTRAQFDAASLDEKADRLAPGRLLELGFYGDEGLLRIRLHLDAPYIDPDLPFFDPPNPQRYLRLESTTP